MIGARGNDAPLPPHESFTSNCDCALHSAHIFDVALGIRRKELFGRVKVQDRLEAFGQLQCCRGTQCPAELERNCGPTLGDPRRPIDCGPAPGSILGLQGAAGAGFGHVLLVDLSTALARLDLSRRSEERIDDDAADHNALVGIGQRIERDGGRWGATARGLDLGDIGHAVILEHRPGAEGLLLAAEIEAQRTRSQASRRSR